MLKKEEYLQMKAEKMPCPYGRKTSVGATRCINCHFNKQDSKQCSGDHEKVKRFMRRLQLDY